MKTQWLAAGLLSVGLVALVLWQNTGGPPPVAVNLPCPNPAVGCTAQLGNSSVTIGLAGALKPLQPFQVWVKAPGTDKVQASFTMVGMNMGFNLYSLRQDAAGVFRAQVTLPTCVSGRRDWVMSVDIDNTTRFVMPFATEL
jgi:hypothetical protein